MNSAYFPVRPRVLSSYQERFTQDYCSRSMVTVLLGIKCYHHVEDDDVRRTTGQPQLSAIVQAWRISQFDS